MTVTSAAFGLGLLAAAGIYAMLLVTLTTDRRLWPPGERTGAYYLHWSLVAAFDVALAATAYLEWNGWVLPRPATLVGGGLLAAVGTAVFLRSASVMDSEEAMGLTGELYTGGPYAYSRNPQYVGMIVGIAGFALAANSRYVAALSAAHVGWVLLLPRAEEPHLREEHGEAYERYVNCVPRFVDGRTVRRLRSNLLD